MFFIEKGSKNSFGSKGPKGGIRIGRYFKIYTYIPLDNTYVVMQMILTFIILIVGFVAFITTYRCEVENPILSTQKLFVNLYLLLIGILLASTVIANFISKNEKTLINRLLIILLISIAAILVVSILKINLDRTYTPDKFKEIYSTVEHSKETAKTRMDIGITGVSLKTEEEFYISECKKAYGIFTTKVYITLIINLLLSGLLVYQISKLKEIEEKKEELEEVDKILYDKEENVKI